MRSVSNCLACGFPINHSVNAVLAPFVAKRIWARDPFPVKLVECSNCDFAFFNPRLEPEEEALLYAGYRDAEYREIRKAFEPWYTERFNSNLENTAFLEARKAKIREVLQGQLNSTRVESVLDFGGARGEIVVDLLPGAVPHVYDISHVRPLEGVIVCENLDDCRAKQVDLVISSNALEHVGFPGEFLSQVRRICTEKSAFWIEVPKEKPFGAKLLVRRVAQMTILGLLRPRVALSLLKPGLTHWMHEHVNYFTEKSLKSLLTRSGWSVVSSGSYRLVGPQGRGEMIWCLARPAY